MSSIKLSTYKPGAISELLGKNSSHEEEADAPEGRLSSIFSTSTLQKFARVVKPAELVKVPRVRDEGDGDNNDLKAMKKSKKKKPRVRNIANEGVREGADILPTSVSAVQSTLLDEPTLQSPTTEDAISRTVFIGNIPTSETVKSIKKLCKEFGDVESVRLRSVPVAGTAVDDAGNQDLVRRVCTNARKFADMKGSFNAYVVFKKPESVTAALVANNRLIGKRHLRVDRATPTLFDPKRTVFIGALPHYTDEEELRTHFAAALPQGQEDIEAVRLIRDPTTLVGKGIGYILFRDRDAVLKALSLHQSLYKKHALRVTVCGKRTKRAESARRDAATGEAEGNKEDEDANQSSRKRPRDEKDRPRAERDMSLEALNKVNAMKRINLKNIMTRNKVLVAKKQKKAVPGKKGKRLGGVVKRAMKAEKASKKLKQA